MGTPTFNWQFRLFVSNNGAFALIGFTGKFFELPMNVSTYNNLTSNKKNIFFWKIN